jgi:hypothetical protein
MIDPADGGGGCAVLFMTEINLIGHKMEAWIHQVGPADRHAEMDELEAVVDNVKGRAAESRPLVLFQPSQIAALRRR